jgi:hypothetical protein
MGGIKVLSFNHYCSGNYKYKEEKKVVDVFLIYKTFSPCLLVTKMQVLI